MKEQNGDFSSTDQHKTGTAGPTGTCQKQKKEEEGEN